MSEFSRAEMREIPGLGGRYLAASDGRIWSVRRNKFRTPSKQQYGYMTITVRHAETKKTVTLSVHRLVALAWLPNPQEKPQINHIDGNKQNNAASNLEWCNGSENMKHAWRTGLQPVTEAMRESARACGITTGPRRRKLTNAMLDEARQRVLAGEKQTTIAKSLGVSKQCLCERLKHGGYV